MEPCLLWQLEANRGSPHITFSPVVMARNVLKALCSSKCFGFSLQISFSCELPDIGSGLMTAPCLKNVDFSRFQQRVGLALAFFRHLSLD
jgi:hypothetical protein